MKVRPLTAADAVALRYVRLEALEREPAAFGSTYEDWKARPLSAYVRRIENGTVFGLWTDRGLEGILAYDRIPGGHARHRATLTAIYVRATLRGRGGGRLLLDAALAQARSDGVVQLELTVSKENPAALAAYSRAGFVKVGRLPRALRIDGRFVDELQMIMKLDI